MKPLLAVLLFGLTPACCQVAQRVAFTAPSPAVPKAARIPLDAIRSMERTFNDRLSGLAGADQPTELMGDTRGVQLDDYGVVFTTEISLVITPGLMPGRPKIPVEMAARVKVTRVARLPLLKAAMQTMMTQMATTFTQLPPTQKVVLVVRLYYGAWEDTTNMPAEVIMRASRADAALGKVETEER